MLERLSPEKAKGGGGAAAAAEAGGDGADAAPPGGDDIQAALAAEVAALKDRSAQPFVVHNVGVSSCIYVECRWEGAPSPSEVVAAACQEAADTRQNKSRFCNRFYPIEHTCYASVEKIGELAEKLVPQYFPEGVEEGVQASRGGWGGGEVCGGGRGGRVLPPLGRAALVRPTDLVRPPPLPHCLGAVLGAV